MSRDKQADDSLTDAANDWLTVQPRFDLRPSNLPGEYIRIVRVRESLLKFHKLRIGERGAISPLLPARIMIQAAQLACGAVVVLGEVTVLARLVAAMIQRRWNYRLTT